MRKRKGQITFLLIVVFDQLLKLVALEKGVASLNKGISLSLLTGSFFSGVIVIVLPLLLLIFFLVSARGYSDHLGLVLVLSGGLSNYLDRIVRGGVVDWISIGSFPIFNLADFSITIGFVWFLVDFIKKQTVS
jgi:signal peptidase II